jgi:nitronate monooxygenase
MKTRITELLGIQYPIIEGGMQWMGRARLAAAVSNAGGLGMITARTHSTSEGLRKEIALTRALTDKPFGVNISLSRAAKHPSYEGWIQEIIDGDVKIVETAGNSPESLMPVFKRHDIRVIHKCTTVRHALSAERYGASAISIDGFEAAGHPGEDDVPGLVLIPAAVRALKIPVIASGGIADGRGMAAALALGAEGVTMGTRFTITQEAPMHENIKRALVASSERQTILIMRTLRNTARFYKNSISEEIVAIESRSGGANFEDIQHLVSGKRGLAALESGDLNSGLICASQAIGLIDDIPTCADLIERMVRECRERLEACLRCLG